jgi:uncharacterized membrane protein YecN with MAPEG domain
MPNALILPITLTIAGAAALINLWLGLRVSLLRRRHKVSIGNGGNTAIETRMRAHANFTEYTPFFLILLALIELAVGSETWLWTIAILYILGRLAHVFGMDRPGASLLRIIGILVTWLCLLGLAAYALYLPYRQRSLPAPVTYAGAATTWANSDRANQLRGLALPRAEPHARYPAVRPFSTL